MDNCVFTSAGNNPSLSIFNNVGKSFYYVGQYKILDIGGVVWEITNGGQNGAIISMDESTIGRASADSWCSDHGSGWGLPSVEMLQVIYKNKMLVNNTLLALTCQILNGNYWASDVTKKNTSNTRCSYYWYYVSMGSGKSNYDYVEGLIANGIQYPSSYARPTRATRHF